MEMVTVEPRKESYWHQMTGQLSEARTAVGQKLPTFDKSLDAYFDQSFPSIIEEWDLLTDSDLVRMENRLQAITNEISILFSGKAMLEKRAADLDAVITSLEKSL
jgi:hypothetical protein